MTIPLWAWQPWEEAIIHEHRCQITPQAIARRINRARADRGLPPRKGRCVADWGRARGVDVCTLPTKDDDGSIYTLPELAAVLKVDRETLYRLCRKGWLKFTRGTRKVIRIRIMQLNLALKRRPWIPKRWPTIEPLELLINNQRTLQKVRAARERHTIVHRITGQTWQTLREASADLGFSPNKIRRITAIPNAYLEARPR